MPIQFNQTDLVSSLLEIDLQAIAANYRAIKSQVGRADVAAAVKADAYGLGMDRVAPALWSAGCTNFFVATLEEGAALRQTLSEARIHVLNGIFAGQETAFSAYQLTPVLNNFDQARLWRDFASEQATMTAPVLHIDTGMNRLGTPMAQVEKIIALPDLRLGGVMSHLACADTPDHPLNAQQLSSFQAVARMFPNIPASLANSAGVFLGTEFHFDMVRVGIGLFGEGLSRLSRDFLQPVIRLRSRILQERMVPAGQTVGYEATYEAKIEKRIITIATGYADGFRTGISNRGHVMIGAEKARIVGRVSMDLMTIDVTDLPHQLTTPGNWVELIGPGMSVEVVAQAGNMIPYELLTSLGNRFSRVYLD
jgi:alanine racemase